MNKYVLKITALLNIIYFSLISRRFSSILQNNIASTSFFYKIISYRSLFFPRGLSSSLEKKGLKGMEAMILGLVVTLIIFFISVYCVLAVLGIFGPEAQTFITRLSFGLGEATPSFG